MSTLTRNSRSVNARQEVEIKKLRRQTSSIVVAAATLPYTAGTGIIVAGSVISLDYAAVLSDDAYDATTWSGFTTIAPSKKSVRDKFETLGTLSTQNGTFSGTSSGTNTGDNAVNSLYSGLVTNATHTGEVTGATSLTIDRSTVFTWTAVHTFSAQDVHNAGVSLGTSGVIVSAVADGASAIGYDFNDSITRTTGFERKLRQGTQLLEVVSWDGRFAFGYSTVLSPQFGHVLSFLSDDVGSPTGAPVYVGILGSVTHSDTAETAPKLLGLVGSANVGTATGLSAVMVNGLLGHVASNADSSFAGKVLACLSGSLSPSSSLASAEPSTKDITFGKSAHPKGAWDHLTVLWAPNFSSASATGYPTNLPGIVSSARLTIQDWGGGPSAGAAAGELWAIRGENINGAVATFPAHTGYIRMTYPRRTGGTTPAVHACHAFWEPWPNTAAIRAAALKGDTYFDDGTNFRIGLWEYDGTAYQKLLQYTQTDAIAGAGGAATLAANTNGATGPTTAAQAKWAKIMCLDGTAGWVPVWV